MKRILMVLLTVVMLAAMFAGTACSKGGVDVKGTKEPTVLATEIPTAELTAEPTAEPTATPIPDNWYIDPSGIIPPTVEILVPDKSMSKLRQWCITRNDEGKLSLDLWTPEKKEPVKQWEIPEDMIRANWLDCSIKTFNQREYLIVCAYLAEDVEEIYYEPRLVYIETSDGKYVYFEVTSWRDWAEGYVLVTTDGDAVDCQLSEGYCNVWKFGKEATVRAIADHALCIDGKYTYVESLEKEIRPKRKYFQSKDF